MYSVNVGRQEYDTIYRLFCWYYASGKKKKGNKEIYIECLPFAKHYAYLFFFINIIDFLQCSYEEDINHLLSIDERKETREDQNTF